MFGIKWDPGKDLKRAVRNISNETNSFLAQTESGFKRDITALGQNVEQNYQNKFNSLLALTQPGGLNNLGQTGMDAGLTLATGGMINPKDQKRITGATNIDRMESEAIAKAENQMRVDAQAMVDAKNAEVSSFLSQLSGQRRRQPGRSQTLLGGASGNNTLLTMLR